MRLLRDQELTPKWNKSFQKRPKMTTDIETLADLRNKVFRRAANIQRLTAVEQINLENE